MTTMSAGVFSNQRVTSNIWNSSVASSGECEYRRGYSFATSRRQFIADSFGVTSDKIIPKHDDVSHSNSHDDDGHEHEHDHGVSTSNDVDDEDLENMFVQGPAGMEWGGPTRGGKRPEVRQSHVQLHVSSLF